MAKITMDSSEWETMKKNEKLLEEALIREKENNAKIEQLQQEKIDVLKNNEKSVTILKKVEVSDHLLCRIPIHDVFERLRRIVHFEKNGDSMRSSRDDSFWDPHYFHRSRGVDYIQYARHEIDAIQNLFYTEKHSLEIDENKTTITTKGLSEVKAEIANDYEKSMSKEHKAMIASVGDLKTEISSWKSKCSDQKLMIDNQSEIISGLEFDVQKLLKKISLIEEEKALLVGKEFVSLTRKILNDNSGFNANSRRIKELKKLWKKED